MKRLVWILLAFPLILTSCVKAGADTALPAPHAPLTITVLDEKGRPLPDAALRINAAEGFVGTDVLRTDSDGKLLVQEAPAAVDVTFQRRAGEDWRKRTLYLVPGQPNELLIRYVAVKKGSGFKVRLPGIAGTGYSWLPVGETPEVALTGQKFIPDKKNLPGSSGKAVLTYARARHSGDLLLAYLRSWEVKDDRPAASEWAIVVFTVR